MNVPLIPCCFQIALLANLTQGERGAALLLQQGRGDLEGAHSEPGFRVWG